LRAAVQGWKSVVGGAFSLELLASSGIDAVGLDHSPELIATCEARGFAVYRQEADEYLCKNQGQFQFMGNWRMAGRRQLPGYLFRRLFLGRYFGRPNTMVLAQKAIPPKSI
jgi:hypothetical protein